MWHTSILYCFFSLLMVDWLIIKTSELGTIISILIKNVFNACIVLLRIIHDIKYLKMFTFSAD